MRSTRLRPEHRHVEKGVIVIADDVVWPIPRIEVRILRTDFIAAWEVATAPQPRVVSLSGRIAMTTQGHTAPASKPVELSGLIAMSIRSFLSWTYKKPPSKKKEGEIKHFLQEGQHPNRETALKAIRQRFLDVLLNEKIIGRLRRELGMEGKPGRKKESGN